MTFFKPSLKGMWRGLLALCGVGQATRNLNGPLPSDATEIVKADIPVNFHPHCQHIVPILQSRVEPSRRAYRALKRVIRIRGAMTH